MNLSGASGNVAERREPESIAWTPSSELVQAADPKNKWIQNFPPPKTSRSEDLGGIWRTLGLSAFASTDFRGMDADVLREYWSRMQLTDSGVVIRKRGDRPAIFKSFEDICGHFRFPELPVSRQSYAAVERPKEFGKWTQHMDPKDVGKKPLSASKFASAEMKVWMSWGVQWFRGNHHHGRYSKADLNIAWAIYSRQLHPQDAILGLLQRRSSQHGNTGAALAGHILAHPFVDELKAQIRDRCGVEGSETQELTDAVGNVGCASPGSDGEEICGIAVGRKRGRERWELQLQADESSADVELERAALAGRENAAAVLVALSRGESPRRESPRVLPSSGLGDAFLRGGNADFAAGDPIGEGASTTVHGGLKGDEIGIANEDFVRDSAEPDADGAGAMDVDEFRNVDKDMDSDAEFPKSNLKVEEVLREKHVDAEAVPLEVVLELPSMESMSEASSFGQPVGCCKVMQGALRGNPARAINCSWNESVDSCPRKTALASSQGPVIFSEKEKSVGPVLTDMIQRFPHDATQTYPLDAVGGSLEASTDAPLKKPIVNGGSTDGHFGDSGDNLLEKAGAALQAIDTDTALKLKTPATIMEVGYASTSERINRVDGWWSRGARHGDRVDAFCMDTERLKQQLLIWERKGHSNPSMILDP